MYHIYKGGIKMKTIMVMSFIMAMFVFPQKVGDIAFDELQIFYYRAINSDEVVMSSYPIIIPARLTTEQRALLIFTEVFEDSLSKKLFVPKNVKVLDVFFDYESTHLILNLSQDILNYGGTYFEDKLVSILLANAAALPEVGYFTVLIEGKRLHLPEGVLINEIRVYDKNIN